ncbi:hypothetical protein SteCoe_6553 [Stentor coeruleus]|uniref:EF-hand domain-containing protein n=1 Tax=Stentor coeruleus TaxID=5963 RepID=A0A1R2CPR3_9CILI|nr:hypothetical protein SteCoe_6553 [Stentor coeruleus]
MGNLLEASGSNYLLSSVQAPLGKFTNCKHHLGSIAQIMRLQKKIAKYNFSEGFYIPVTSLRTLFSSSPLKGHEILIEHFYSNPKLKKVNVMEILASIIVYSACTLEEKIRISIEVFDFDNNKILTKDEMVIMCISFMRGIGIMTQKAGFNTKVVEDLAHEAFDLADSNPDGMITYEELTRWVKSSQVLLELFTKTMPKTYVPSRRRSLLESTGFELEKKVNWVNASYESKVWTNTSPQKTHYQKLTFRTAEETMQIIKNFYYKFSDANGKILAKVVYEFLAESIEFKDIKDTFLQEYKLKLLTDVSYEEVVSTILRRGRVRYKTVSANYSCSPRRSENGIWKDEVVEKKKQGWEESQDLSENQLMKLKKLFARYDQDKDGHISFNEFKRALQDSLTLESIVQLFEEYDIHKSGQLELPEFVRMFVADNVKLPTDLR